MERGSETPKPDRPDTAEGHGPTSGGDPDGVGKCVYCGEIYPVQKSERGELRPTWGDGRCKCGNSDFLPCTET